MGSNKMTSVHQRSLNVLVIPVLWLVLLTGITQSLPSYKLGLLTPTNTDTGKRFETIFKAAVEAVNELCTRPINLTYQVENENVSDCRAGVEALKTAGVIAIIGPTTRTCAEESNVQQTGTIPLITPSITWSGLSNKTAYPDVFRTTTSDIHQANALIGFLQYYNITQIGVFSMDDSYSTGITHELRRIVANLTQITVLRNVTCSSTSSAIDNCLTELSSSGARAVVLIASPSDANGIIDRIAHLNMHGMGWTWLTTTGVLTDPATRTLRQTTGVLDGFISVAPKGAEGPIYLNLLSRLLSSSSGQAGIDATALDSADIAGEYAGQLIDAINTVVAVLVNQSVQDPSKKLTRAELFQELRKINQADSTQRSATALNSKVFFDSNQDGPITYDIRNVVNGKRQVVAIYADGKIFSKRSAVFPGGLSQPIVKYLHYKIAGFFQLSTMGAIAQEWVSAFKLAVETVNADPALKVTFDYQIIDEGSNPTACEQQAQNLSATISIVIGAASSGCSAAIANVAAQRKTPQVSYASTSDALANKTRFPFFIRTVASDTQQGRALAEIVTKYGWNKVGIMATATAWASGLEAAVKSQLESRGVTLTGSWHPPSVDATQTEIENEFTQMLYSNNLSAVNVLISDPIQVPNMLQAAQTKGMTGSDWTWLAIDGVTSSDLSSSTAQVRQAAQGIVGVGPKGGSGSKFDDLLKVWSAKSEAFFPGRVHTTKTQVSPYTPQVYDAVIAVAHAVSSLYESSQLTRATPSEQAGELIMSALERTTFESVTGRNTSLGNGTSSPPLDCVNFVGDKWTVVGDYQTETRQLTLAGRGDIVWSGGSLSAHTQDVKRHDSYLHLAIVLGVVLFLFVLAAVALSFYFVRQRGFLDLDDETIDVLAIANIIENKYKDNVRKRVPYNPDATEGTDSIDHGGAAYNEIEMTSEL